jgi:hypothetical protein
MKYLSISTEIKDSHGEPMTFAIDENYVLSVTMRTEDRAAGWVRHDLIATNQGLKAQVFGISQNFNGEIYLVLAAGQEPLGPSQLFISAGLPNNPADPIWQNLKDRWIPLHISPTPTRITEVIVDAPESTGETPLIVIGTEERIGKVPKYLRVKSEVRVENVELFPMLANADELLDIKAGRPAYGRGVYVLYRRGNNIVLEFDGLPDLEYNVPIGATLTTPPGAVELQPKVNELGFTDLYVIGNGKFLFSYDNQTAYAQAEKIADDDGMLTDQITSRSSITEDYRKNPDASELEPYPVYRTSISLPLRTVTVDLWASEETEVEINGTKYTIDPVMPARVMVPPIHKLSVSLPARELRCPYLMLRTNLMRPEQRHVIYPDVEVHKKIVDLKDSALHDAREQLGIHLEFTKEHLDHVQKALQSMAQTIQYTYNRKPHGVHHDRAVLPKNMDDPHFMLDFSGGKAQYHALDKAAVAQHIAGATLLQGQAAQNFWDDLGAFFQEAGSVIVHTVESIGHDIVDTAEHVYDDAVRTVHLIGEDLVHGDGWRIMQDFLQGGEAIGRDLFTGAANIVGDLVSGAGQLVIVTLKLADKAVQFVLHNTGAVGKVLGWMFEKIGAALGQVVDWLLDQIGWNDILHIHDVLREHINQSLDQVKGLLEQLKQQTDGVFTSLKQELSRSIDEKLQQLGVQKLIEQPAPHPAFSGHAEKSEWLLTRFSDNSAAMAVSNMPGFPLATMLPAMDRFLAAIEERFGEDGQKALDAFAGARTLIEKMLSNSAPTADLLLGVGLELVKGLALFGLDAINVILDALIDLTENMLDFFKKLINTPLTIPFISDLYATITKGRQLSLLDFTALVIATPATLFSKAIGNGVPFAEYGRATATLPAPEKDAQTVRDWGTAYAGIRMAQAILATAANISTAVDAAKQLQALKDGNPDDVPSGLLGRREWRIRTQTGEAVEIDAKFYVDNALSFITFILDMTAQFGASPVGHGDLGKGALNITPPPIEKRDDPLGAPDYWGHIAWFYDWGAILVPNFATLLGCVFSTEKLVARLNINARHIGVFGDAEVVLNFLSGIVSLAFMSHMDVVERRKMAHLKTEYFEVDSAGDYTTSSDKSWQTWTGWTWCKKDAQGNDQELYYVPKKAFKALDADKQAEYALYLKWAEQGGMDQPPDLGDPLHVRRLWGIERKGFANVISAFPAIGQIGALQDFVLASDGASLILTGVFDVLGCLGEGITHLERTKYNELF